MFRVACSVVVPNEIKVSLLIVVAVAVKYAVVVMVETTETVLAGRDTIRRG